MQRIPPNVAVDETTWCYVLKDSSIQNHDSKNLKSHIIFKINNWRRYR